MSCDLNIYIDRLFKSMDLCKTQYEYDVLTQLTEAFIEFPDLDLNGVIDGYAKAHGIKKKHVERILDNGFCVYDADKLQRITNYTRTRPITNKDAFCDTAVTVRIKYFSDRGT